MNEYEIGELHGYVQLCIWGSESDMGGREVVFIDTREDALKLQAKLTEFLEIIVADK
ncbi:hypothetical protein [Erwinia phage Pecta]|nr:hypothetical protein [Erwinia phage Pecta]